MFSYHILPFKFARCRTQQNHLVSMSRICKPRRPLAIALPPKRHWPRSTSSTRTMRPCRSTRRHCWATQDPQLMLEASLLCVRACQRTRFRDGAVAESRYRLQVRLVALRLHSPSLKTPIMLDLSTPAKMAELKKTSTVTIKEVRSRLSIQLKGSGH